MSKLNPPLAFNLSDAMVEILTFDSDKLTKPVEAKIALENILSNLQKIRFIEVKSQEQRNEIIEICDIFANNIDKLIESFEDPELVRTEEFDGIMQTAKLAYNEIRNIREINFPREENFLFSNLNFKSKFDILESIKEEDKGQLTSRSNEENDQKLTKSQDGDASNPDIAFLEEQNKYLIEANEALEQLLNDDKQKSEKKIERLQEEIMRLKQQLSDRSNYDREVSIDNDRAVSISSKPENAILTPEAEIQSLNQAFYNPVKSNPSISNARLSDNFNQDSFLDISDPEISISTGKIAEGKIAEGKFFIDNAAEEKTPEEKTPARDNPLLLPSLKKGSSFSVSSALVFDNTAIVSNLQSPSLFPKPILVDKATQTLDQALDQGSNQVSNQTSNQRSISSSSLSQIAKKLFLR